MREEMINHKKRVFITLGFACLVIAGGIWFRASREDQLRGKGGPGCLSFGQGKTVLALFEDFRCGPCHRFMEEIFPQIEANYIETNRARFLFIPVAFLEGSKPLANAALGVYQIDSSLFVPFVHELFQIEEPTPEEILSAARKVGITDLARLAQCIEQEQYYKDLEKNLRLGEALMGDEFGTPTLFLNGKRIDTTWRDISQKMDKKK